MKHYYLEGSSSEHYAVGVSSETKKVLVQVQEQSIQARIAVTVEQARELIWLLNKAAHEVEMIEE